MMKPQHKQLTHLGWMDDCVSQKIKLIIYSVKQFQDRKCFYMSLTLSTLGKIFGRWHSEIFFLFFPGNRIWHFMQIDNLHEISNPVFWEK